ncbi:hypothetical protein [Singulisphaera sp. PoT]|uniref:hypothetical protein n=1 Tax=Singulisphaera sp. PoT TaxID=3411797 RepID=UPI003BF5E54C
MPTTNRRDFVRNLTLGAAATSIAATGEVAAADEPEKKDEPKKEPKSPPTEAEARMELLLARFGEHLDADARGNVRLEVEAIVQRAERLRKFELDNGDGPFPVFTPYRAPLGEHP